MTNTDNLYDLFDQQTELSASGRELPPFDLEEYKAYKQKERDDVFALIETTSEKMKSSSELFQTYLDVQARMDRYSVNNAIILTAAKPDATHLREFDDWKADGVYVKKNEKSIAILEPGKEYTREDGSIGTSINVKRVFDVSQTDRRPRMAPAVTRDERLILKSLITDAPCVISISDNLANDTNAVYSQESKTVYIRQGLDGPAIFRALTQELAHAHMDRRDENYKRSENTFAAYCVSYILCKRNGVSVDSYAFDKIPERYAAMEGKDFRAELGKIREVANDMSRDMNRVLEAQERKSKERSDDAR